MYVDYNHSAELVMPMMNIVHKTLAPLASFKVQDRYIVHGTKEEYLLPEDLLNSAINVIFEQKAVPLEETDTLKKLKEALRACDLPDGMSLSKLVTSYDPWILVREKSKEYLAEIGFDLEAWERNEL